MKKIALFLFTLLTVLNVELKAQDTVDGTIQMGNYFYPNDWPELKKGYYGTQCSHGPYGGGEFGVLYETYDTLVIYGIAAAIIDGGNWGNTICQDTSYTNSYEFLRIYESVRASGVDTLHCIKQVKIHLHTTPIAYYANHSTLEPPSPSKIFPMYERYFYTPITVVDSFYIGMTQFIPRTHYDQIFSCPPLFLGGVGTGSHEFKEISYQFSHGWSTGTIDGFPLHFPILTPPDTNYVWDTIATAADTNIMASDTVVAGDTLIVCDTVVVCDTLIVGYDTIVRYDTIVNYDTLLALPEHGLLGSLVGVMPNPAAETAKVVSSFGLTMVEAFNMAGEKVHTLRLPDAPLTATLDVRRWPSGTYLLRIHTPQGTAVKKLVVRN